jgi:hypothetical protein
MRDGEIVVKGYKEFLSACNHADKNVKREVREILRGVGNVVKRDAADRFSAVSTKTAAGYRTVVRQSGVMVDQSLRKTTGLHPEYGARQMRQALLPALRENEERLEREMEQAIDLIGDVFEYGSY